MSDLTRRSVLKAMGAAAASISTPIALSSNAFAGSRDKELNILCWEGYNSSEVLDPYRRLMGPQLKLNQQQMIQQW